MEKVYLPDSDNYYRIGNKVFNRRGMELKPDPAGRYKIRATRNVWFYARIEGLDGSINWPLRKDTTKLKHIENFPGYFLDGNSVVNRWGITLRPQRTKYYRLKDSKGVFRSVRLETLQSF